MTRKRRFFYAALCCLMLLMLFPATASAATKKISANKYLGKDSNVVKYFVYNPNSYGIPVYCKKSTKGGTYGMLEYGGCIELNTAKLKKNKKYAWVPVKMTTAGAQGYVRASDVKIATLNLNRLRYNPTVYKAVSYGLQFLGTRFVLGGTSITYGIDCANFVKQIYEAAGYRMAGAHTNYLQLMGRTVSAGSLKAGDLLFYLKYDTSGPIDHVAMYVCNGFMINSSGHYGETYPFGGITVKRVNYGARKPVLVKRLF